MEYAGELYLEYHAEDVGRDFLKIEKRRSIIGKKYAEARSLNMKTRFKQIRDNYVIRQAERAVLPEFSDTAVCRRRVRFSGRVQKVGFRLEVCQLAKRLGLTGWCMNLENGDVLAEFQGTGERIDFLVSFMESWKRIKIRNKQVEELELIPGEKSFEKK